MVATLLMLATRHSSGFLGQPNGLRGPLRLQQWVFLLMVEQQSQFGSCLRLRPMLSRLPSWYPFETSMMGVLLANCHISFTDNLIIK